MVHASQERETLTEEVAKLKAATPEKQTAHLADLEKEATTLRNTVLANRRVFPPVVGLAFLLGIFVGFAVPHFRTKKTEDKPK